jgi:hypothetical protein
MLKRKPSLFLALMKKTKSYLHITIAIHYVYKKSQKLIPKIGTIRVKIAKTSFRNNGPLEANVFKFLIRFQN